MFAVRAAMMLVAGLLAGCAAGEGSSKAAGGTSYPSSVGVPGMPSRLAESTMIPGKCLAFSMSGEDLTRSCSGSLGFQAWADGVTGATFHAETGSQITFMGTDLPNLNANTDAFAVEAVGINLNIRGVPPTTGAAIGRCTYTNPFAAPMAVRCRAALADGRPLEGQFRAHSVMR